MADLHQAPRHAGTVDAEQPLYAMDAEFLEPCARTATEIHDRFRIRRQLQDLGNDDRGRTLRAVEPCSVIGLTIQGVEISALKVRRHWFRNSFEGRVCSG